MRLKCERHDLIVWVLFFKSLERKEKYLGLKFLVLSTTDRVLGLASDRSAKELLIFPAFYLLLFALWNELVMLASYIRLCKRFYLVSLWTFSRIAAPS